MGPPERAGTLELDGRRLAWRVLGSGPPLILINGYAATAHDWDPTLLSLLARRFEVVCPDNRGEGDSELGDPQQLTVEAMADDVERLLDELGHEQAAIAGWSMGGFLAQALATRRPRRVSTLVLMSTDPGGRRAVRADPEVWARLTDHSGSPREQAARLISLLFPPPVAAEVDRQFGDVVAGARAQLSDEALRAQEAAMERWHGKEQPPAPEDAPPVVIAHGTEDVVIPPANADALALHWPGAKIRMFAGGGHAFMAQEPQRLAELIVTELGGT